MVNSGSEEKEFSDLRERQVGDDVAVVVDRHFYK